MIPFEPDTWAFCPQESPDWEAPLSLDMALSRARTHKGGSVRRVATDREGILARYREHLSAKDVLETVGERVDDNLFHGASEALNVTDEALAALDAFLDQWARTHLRTPTWVSAGPEVELDAGGNEKRWVVEELHYGTWTEEKRYVSEKGATSFWLNRNNPHKDGSVRVRFADARLPSALPIASPPAASAASESEP